MFGGGGQDGPAGLSQRGAGVMTQVSPSPGNPASSRMALNSNATATAVSPFDPWRRGPVVVE
jgi:hypothetical protein